MSRLLITTLLLYLPLPRLAAPAELSPPRSFEAIAESETTIDLYWLPSRSQEVTGYRITRDGSALATVNRDSVKFEDAILAPDSTHTYTIEAVSDGGTSGVRKYIERTFASWPTARTGKRGLPTAGFDVVVAQASSGGVAAAIEAARRGLTVALIEPTTRVGGMPANGLSATDLRRAEHAAGIFVQFRDRVKQFYAAEGIKTNGLSYEPRVALQAMKSLLYEQKGITIFRRTVPVGVVTHTTAFGTHIDGIRVEQLDANGGPTGRKAELQAKVVVDATDCGDIAAWAGAPFRLGREPRSKREPHNGVIYYNRAADAPLPGSTGKGDSRIMAYTYLLTVKDYGAGADKTIPKPPGYREDDFTHSPAWKESWAVTSGRMPGDKMELNQHPQGGDIQAINYRYPLDGYAVRSRIEKLYREHVLCYLYYIQTALGQKQIGLPDDEYRDSGGFPPLLYVREGRRILGDQLPDETDITTAPNYTRPESIGIGDYPMDSHAVRPKTNWSTPDMGEGEWWLYKETPVHQIPIGIMIPKGLDNVFVTTAVSSTHVSFGTYRLELVRMELGQDAAIAADLCLKYHLTSHEVPARQIQDDLLPHAANPLADTAARLEYYPDITSDTPGFRSIEYLTAHGITLPGDHFNPTTVATVGELYHLLTEMAARTYSGPAASEPSTAFAYLGAPADRKALDAMASAQPSDKLTRAALAHWLVRVLPGQVYKLNKTPIAYVDITDRTIVQDAQNLADMGIDSILLDGTSALDKQGAVHFRPDAEVSRADLYKCLFIAQIGIGPMFDDLPTEVETRR